MVIKMRKAAILIFTVFVLVSVVLGSSVLNLIKVGVVPEPTKVLKDVNKLKVEIAPEQPIVGEKVKIIVRDSENNPVEGAKIYVKKEDGETTCIGETNSRGELTYVFGDRGTYWIGIEKEGFFSNAS